MHRTTPIAVRQRSYTPDELQRTEEEWKRAKNVYNHVTHGRARVDKCPDDHVVRDHGDVHNAVPTVTELTLPPQSWKPVSNKYNIIQFIKAALPTPTLQHQHCSSQSPTAALCVRKKRNNVAILIRTWADGGRHVTSLRFRSHYTQQPLLLLVFVVPHCSPSLSICAHRITMLMSFVT